MKKTMMVTAAIATASLLACAAPSRQDTSEPRDETVESASSAISFDPGTGTVYEGRYCNCQWGHAFTIWGVSCIDVCENNGPSPGDEIQEPGEGSGPCDETERDVCEGGGGRMTSDCRCLVLR